MAELDAFITGPRPTIRVGDALDIELVVRVPETREHIALAWEVGWVASGKETNTCVVSSGSEAIDRIAPDEEQSWTIPFDVPPEGPISYNGELLSVAWYVKASLEIPWAIDPSATFGFVVKPRRVRPKR